MLFRIRPAKEPTHFLLPVNILLNILIYKVSYDYAVAAAFLICNAFLTVVMFMTRGRRGSIQILSVVAIYTIGFTTISSFLGLNVTPNTFLFVRIASGFFASEMMYILPEVFPKSFSAGELGLLVQSVTAFLSVSLACIFDSYIKLSYSFCGHMTSTKVLQVLAIGITFFFVNCLFILKRFKTDLTLLVYGAFFYAVAMVYFALLKILDREPILWLYESTTRTSTRIYLLRMWGLLFAVSVLFAFLWTKYCNKSSLTKARKFFHVAIIFVFILGLKEDPEMLSFFAGCLLIIFVILEMWRVTKVKPLAKALDACFNSFKDDQDPGILTLTHIYLLIACSLHLWLLPRGNKVSLSTCSGVIAVGFGDTAASVMGSFGRHRWPNSKKTIEGSIAAALFMFLGSIFLYSFLNPGQSLNSIEITVIFLISCLVSAIEAKTKEIDNFVLPIYHNILILLAKTYFSDL